MKTYHYVLASQHFLIEEEPLEEVLKERTRDYLEKQKEIDFWLVKQPAFLEAPEMQEIKTKCPQPAAAVCRRWSAAGGWSSSWTSPRAAAG